MSNEKNGDRTNLSATEIAVRGWQLDRKEMVLLRKEIWTSGRSLQDFLEFFGSALHPDVALDIMGWGLIKREDEA